MEYICGTGLSLLRNDDAAAFATSAFASDVYYIHRYIMSIFVLYLYIYVCI